MYSAIYSITIFFLFFASTLFSSSPFAGLYSTAHFLPLHHTEYQTDIRLAHGYKTGFYSNWMINSRWRYGLTHRLTGSVGFNLSQIHKSGIPGHQTTSVFKFNGLSSEIRYQIKNPFLDGFGLAFTCGGSFSGDAIVTEQRLIADLNRKRTIASINIIGNQFGYFMTDPNNYYSQYMINLGLSRSLTHTIMAGIESQTRYIFSGDLYDDYAYQTHVLGPVIHIKGSQWWLTSSFLFNLDTSRSFQPDYLPLQSRYELRILIGRLL